VSLGTQLGARYSFAACFSAGSSAIDLETGATRMIEATTINALSSIALLIAITLLYPTKRLIHVFLIGRAFPCAADIVGHHHTGAPTIWKLAARTRTAMASPSRAYEYFRRLTTIYSEPPSLVAPKADPLGDDGSAARSGGCPRPHAPGGYQGNRGGPRGGVGRAPHR